MMGMLLAYDATGRVVGTLDYLVRHDPDTKALLGLVDFIATEANGVALSPSVWTVDGAAGSVAWPEWLGPAAHRYRVERAWVGGVHIATALVDDVTGERRERAPIMEAIADRIAAANGGAADLRDLVGGPDRPILGP